MKTGTYVGMVIESMNDSDLPQWVLKSTEIMNLIKRQGMTLDEAYERVERLAIEEEPARDD